jgi:hypothetical protein
MNEYFDIQIKDNFFSIFQQRELLTYSLSKEIRWRYQHKISSGDSKEWEKNYKIKDTSGFSSLFNEEDSYQAHLKNTLVKQIETQFNLKIKQVLRMMFVFYPPNPTYPENFYLTPHVDNQDFQIKNFLYYINTNDAETFFFNKLHELGTKSTTFEPVLYTSVVPKQGRAVLFDGRIYHSANISKISSRITLNLNFIVSDQNT